MHQWARRSVKDGGGRMAQRGTWTHQPLHRPPLANPHPPFPACFQVTHHEKYWFSGDCWFMIPVVSSMSLGHARICQHRRASTIARIITPFRDRYGLGKVCRRDAPWQNARGCGIGARTETPYDGTAWATEAYGHTTHPVPPIFPCLLPGDTHEIKDSPLSSVPIFVAAEPCSHPPT